MVTIDGKIPDVLPEPTPKRTVKRIILSKRRQLQGRGIMLSDLKAPWLVLSNPIGHRGREKLGFTMYEYRAKANPLTLGGKRGAGQADLRVELGKLGFHREGHYSSARGGDDTDDWPAYPSA